MRILFRGARIVDPATGRDGLGDLLLAEGRIAEAGTADRVIEARGLVLAPGLVDLSVRLREPGGEYRATLQSELEAAAAGGVTSLACPPDTDPPLDEPGLVEMLRRRAQALAGANVLPLGALTVGLAGERLTEMAELAAAGCVAFSQAERPLADTQLLWRALEYAGTFGYAVWLRPEDPWLARGAVAHDGAVAARLGLPGVPAFAETIALAAILELVRATRTRVHLCRLSTAAAVDMVRAARREGLPISCDVTVQHLHLCDEDIGDFDSHLRLVPPVRSRADHDALGRGLAAGTIDALCSDHAPVDEDAKQVPFGEAEPGASAVELLLPLALAWGEAQGLSLAQTLSRVTTGPARVLGLAAGRIAAGAPADLVLFDPQARLRVAAERLRSQGKNTPFLGAELPGRVHLTLVGGRIVYETA